MYSTRPKRFKHYIPIEIVFSQSLSKCSYSVLLDLLLQILIHICHNRQMHWHLLGCTNTRTQVTVCLLFCLPYRNILWMDIVKMSQSLHLTCTIIRPTMVLRFIACPTMVIITVYWFVMCDRYVINSMHARLISPISSYTMFCECNFMCTQVSDSNIISVMMRTFLVSDSFIIVCTNSLSA